VKEEWEEEVRSLAGEAVLGRREGDPFGSSGGRVVCPERADPDTTPGREPFQGKRSSGHYQSRDLAFVDLGPIGKSPFSSFIPGHDPHSADGPSWCRKIISRTHFDVLEMNLVNGRCKFCDFPIEGKWT
jgi:hypothetical protein